MISFISKFTPDVEIELVGNCHFSMQNFLQEFDEQLVKRRLKIVATGSEQFKTIQESESESENELESAITQLNKLLFRRE